MRRERLDRDYFEDLYAESADPWGFETSDYERRKYERTLESLGGRRFRRALEVRAETPAVRDRYGWNLFGQSVLLARRLVEAGVPLVTAIWDCTKEGPDIATLGWDTHWDHFKA